MNILYLIGNGFDLCLGFNTTYEDFYKWYISSYSDRKQNVVEFINKVNKEKPNNKLWSCMEMALGEYTSNLDSSNAFNDYIELHDNIVEAMSIFIKEQEKTLDLSKISRERFNHYFINPESYAGLRPKDEQAFRSLRQDRANKSTTWNLDIMSFNYSSSLETITGFEKGTTVGAYYKNGSSKIILRSIEHIHGTTDDRLIIGVNDKSQVKNEALHNVRGLEYIVKPSFNALCGEGHDERCMQLIANASMIVVFGCSFGASDLKWWSYIISRMKVNSITLLLFHYEKGVNFTALNKHKKQHYLDDVKDSFIASSQVKLTESEKQSI